MRRSSAPSRHPPVGFDRGEVPCCTGQPGRDLLQRTGPDRHGISNTLFLYLRDPDQHRIELFTTHDPFIDLEEQPICWNVSNLVHLAGLASERPWADLLRINIDGSHTVLEAARLGGAFTDEQHPVGGTW